MNPGALYTSVAVFGCVLAMITITMTTPLSTVEEDAIKNFPPSISYFLNAMKTDGLSLEAPPNVYSNKIKRYNRFPLSTSKRNGFWIWMPAQGYVSVPAEQLAGGSSTGSGSGNLLRYG